MRRQTRRAAKPAPTTPKQAFLSALVGGRNETMKATLGRLLERSDNLRLQDDGRWCFWAGLAESDKGPALAVANFDRFAHCNALITHDLHSFTCWDVAGLIETLRLH